MILADYYKILGLPLNSSVEEIKRAYRKKARMYHPDINHSPDAKDLFIRVTEAYDFLLNIHDKTTGDEQVFNQAMENWKKYRQNRSRQRAYAYSQTSYNRFKNTRFYKTTRILDGTTIISSFVVSILVLIYTIFGYIFRLTHPIPGLDQPSVFSFLLLLILGMIFFVVSFIYLRAYNQLSKKRRRRTS
jgi:hypothetical protein